MSARQQLMGLVGRSPSVSVPFEATDDFVIDDNYDLEGDPLVREEDIGEVEDFLLGYPGLTKEYIPLAVIGEGTSY